MINTDYNSLNYDLDLNQWYLFWFIQANYELPLGIDFELNSNYGKGALEGQINVDWLAELDVYFGKRFLEDKVKINLGLSDILNRGFTGTIDYENGYATVNRNGSRQNIQLRVVYNFGSKFGKSKTKRDSF